MNKLTFTIFLVANIFFANASNAVTITASIKPYYNIAAAIAKNTKKINVLLQGYSSPHTFNLKPSDIKKLHSSDIIIWGGSTLEPYLTKVLENEDLKPKVIDVSKINSIARLEIKCKHCLENAHKHQHSSHGKLSSDPHYWLSPKNGIIIAKSIQTKLSELDLDNNKIYLDNLRNFTHKTINLIAELEQKLAPYKSKNFMVYHDGYQYFESFFGLRNIGVINYTPGVPLGAKHTLAIRKKIKTNNVGCIFKEPQFNAKIIDNLEKTFSVKQGNLNPMGEDYDMGPDGYFKLLRKIANSFIRCFAD